MGVYQGIALSKKKILEKNLELSTEVSSFSNQCDIYIIELTSANDKSETEKYISMNNRLIVRLTENELKDIMGKCVRRALIKEHIDMQREIKLAQQTLCKFPLSDVGLRLEGTKFYKQYQQMKDAIIALNDALIHYIRGEGKN